MSELYSFRFVDDPTTLLSHHGIPGMHWGIRRFQNYDGTRIGSDKSSGSTGSDKSSGSVSNNKVTPSEVKGKKVKKPKSEDPEESVSKAYKTINNSWENTGDNASKAAKELSDLIGKNKVPNTKKIQKQMALMDNKQLDESIKRFKLESDYMKYAAAPTTSLGRQRVSNAVDSLGRTVSVGKYVGMTALAAWKLTHWYYF